MAKIARLTMAHLSHKRNWLRAVFVVILVSMTAMLYEASQHRTTGPDEGVGVHGKASELIAGKSTIRVGSFNIHGGKGRDGRRDIRRIAKCLQGLDFVGLNEVCGSRLGQPQDQAELLGRELGMGWLFAPTVRVWHWRESGNGLLSRRPVTFWQRIPLPQRHDHSHRNVVLVGLECERGRAVRILITHINRRDPERSLQLRTVINLFTSLEAPAVLLGDLNTGADDPQLRELLEMPGVSDSVGQVLGEQAQNRIDWIITRGLDCVDAGMLDEGASDHPLVWAELR